jgi:para-nitrobenzyl esterase
MRTHNAPEARLPLLFLAAASVLVAACGSDDHGGVARTATPTATIVATATNTAAPTLTATSVPTSTATTVPATALPTVTATDAPTATSTSTPTETPTATATNVPIQQGTRIAIADGEVQGEVDGGSRRFLGIPFAAPPVGALRWRPPQPVVPWDGVLEANHMSLPCAQFEALTTPASDNEDCLYLNVWAPDPAPSAPLPVMLWFHGGGNTTGSTADLVPLGVGGLFYNGRTLAESRGVIVVSTNYRLNIFGFLSHPALAAEDPTTPYSGNQALLDQNAALKWVRDNIAAFGGDPHNVTIFGESAGSFDVCYHVASPVSRGLFEQAISESGGCTTRRTTLAEADQQTEALIDAVGCRDAADVLACLRELPVSTLLDHSDPFGPIVDGRFLPDQPRTLYDAGDIAHVPYILGSNSDEGTLFLLGTKPVQTEEEYRAVLASRFGSRADEIAAAYPAADFVTPNDALARVVGDSGLVCPTYDSARRAAAAGSPVHLYNFSWPVLADVLPFLGATHGAEIAFVFGSVPAPTADDQAVAAAMQGYWSRFAGTGDPNGDGALEWPLYDDATDQRINFAPEPSILTHFRRDQCELWWRYYAEDFGQTAP